MSHRLVISRKEIRAHHLLIDAVAEVLGLGIPVIDNDDVLSLAGYEVTEGARTWCIAVPIAKEYVEVHYSRNIIQWHGDELKQHIQRQEVLLFGGESEDPR